MSTQELLADHRSVLPEKLNHLAACRVCALVKDRQMFESEGCNNCTHTQPTIWNAGEFLEMTTPIFSGTIAMLRPTESWVAKWQFMKKNYVPGLYAIEVPERITAKEALEFISR